MQELARQPASEVVWMNNQAIDAQIFSVLGMLQDCCQCTLDSAAEKSVIGCLDGGQAT